MAKLVFFLLFAFMAWAEDPALQALDKHVQTELRKGHIVGAAVAVFDNHQITFMKAYGLRRKGHKKEPVNLDTVFQLGSVSKPITASLVARLDEKGVLNFASERIRHILSHTTGYARAGWNAKIERGWSRELLLEKLADSPRETPGEVYDYNNLAFSQIEDIIEDAAHAPFKQVLKQYLLGPLRMTETTIGFKDFAKQKNRAWPHVLTRRGIRTSKQFSRNYHETVVSAAGINSSIRDMARFLETVISDQSLRSFFEPVTPTPTSNWFRKIKRHDLKAYYGYGWHLVDIDGQRMVFHGGWVKGFINFVAFLPDQNKGIVILSNSETPFGLHTATQFLLDDIKS